MRYCLSLIFTFGLFLEAFSQPDLSTYLPTSFGYNSEIPTPKDILGYHPGEWHVSHDQMVYFMRTMAQRSPRIEIDEYGFSYEKRPLIHAIISHPDNLSRIEDIKKNRQNMADPNQNVDTTNEPIVVWIGPSVHGNEASGVNSALVTTYFLAAATGDEIEKILKNTVIIVEGSFNPDGMNRFASWVNSHKSLTKPSPDPQDLEHNEAWPRARTNHYWFDLNRDWLPVQHPESQSRINKLHDWKPNVVTDHHEMGSNSTFFFQPGIESRQNPLIPQTVWNLTEKIANYHVQALDSIGELYYAKESFDEFYFGYGSTYPDITGAIGILFEQGSTRGHAQKTVNGLRNFSDGVRNHFNAALSTIRGAHALRTEMHAHLSNFYQNAITAANNDPVKAYVFGATEDKAKVHELVRILKNHKITVNKLSGQLNASGHQFKSEDSYIVSLQQPEYRVAKTIFETEQSFGDSLFYDVSSWTFPLSMGIPYASLSSRTFNSGLIGKEVESLDSKGELIGSETNYAYAFEITGYYAHRALYQILDRKLRAKVATEPFQYNSKDFDYGSIIVPVKDQELSSQEIRELMALLAKENAIDIHTINTGYTSKVNLGSNYFQDVKKPKTAIVGGDGVFGNEVGEIWHLLDYRMQTPLTILDNDNLSKLDLSKYNTLIMVNGSYDTLLAPTLKGWISDGGTLIAQKNAVKWLSDRKLIQNEFLEEEKDTLEIRPYADMRKYEGAKLTSGTIFNATIDRSHPVLYGYERNTLALFRNHNMFMKRTKSSYGNPANYTSSPLISGYVFRDNLKKISNTTAVSISSVGKGRIISILDNPNFRAIWYGTNKMLMNAIFFGRNISAQSTK